MGLLPLEYKRIIKDIYTLCYLKKEKNIPNAKSPSPIMDVLFREMKNYQIYKKLLIYYEKSS